MANDAVVSAVSVSTTAIALAGGGSSKGSLVWNDSASDLYVLCGAGTASASNWSYKVQPGEMLEMPFQYSGAFSMVLASGTGTARVTRFS